MVSLSDFGFTEIVDCSRKYNVIQNIVDAITCEHAQQKFARKVVVDEVPHPDNCRVNQFIFNRDDKQWWKCCQTKTGFFSRGPNYCQHISALYSIPAKVETSMTDWPSAMRKMMVQIGATAVGGLMGSVAGREGTLAGGALAGGAVTSMVNSEMANKIAQERFVSAYGEPDNTKFVKPIPDPIQNEAEPRGVENQAWCFETAPPNRYKQEGCFCWKGKEQCIYPKEASITFL